MKNLTQAEIELRADNSHATSLNRVWKCFICGEIIVDVPVFDKINGKTVAYHSEHKGVKKNDTY